MSRRPARGREEPHDEHPDERWLVSYSDMVTVLLCLFIVLFAMSSVDKGKYEQVKNSLAEGFGTTDIVENTAQVSLAAAGAEPQDELQKALAETDRLEQLRQQIEANLTADGQQGAVDYKIDQRGLTVRLVSSETFFAPNRADLTDDAVAILGAISPVLAPTDYQVSVEGYADVLRPVDPYPTNWELSSGRATAVVRSMIDRGGLQPGHVSAVGFGDARAASAGNSAEELAMNRRVDIVVLSPEPESVRALIPDAVEDTGGAGSAPEPAEAAPAEAAAEPAETGGH